MEATSRLEVDLAAIERNVSTIRRACSGRTGHAVGICAVLKADGYSLGAARIAKRLEIAAVDMLAVFTLDQARALADMAIRAPILVLMPVRSIARNDTLYLAMAQGRLHLSVHDTAQLDSLIQHADRLGTCLPLHVEVNTGMNRGGVRPDDAERIVARIAAHPRLTLAGLYTHFASADCDGALTRRQDELFGAWLERVRPHVPKGCVVHQANTFGTFREPSLHRDMVRLGLGLLGYAEEEMTDRAGAPLLERAQELAPAVRWTSEVMHVSEVAVGETVGYGAAWRAARPTRLALVPVGYADGYPLALSNKGVVGVTLPDGIKGFAPVVGRVSMDQITIDVTDMPAGSVSVGSPVEVIGADRTAPNHLPKIARLAGTIAHEFLCGLSVRLQRVYLAVEREEREAGARPLRLPTHEHAAARLRAARA